MVEAWVDFKGIVIVRQSSSAELKTISYITSIKTGTPAELKALFEVGQGSTELYAKFEAQAVKDLYAKFETQATADLIGRFHVGQNSAELKAEMVIRGAGSLDAVFGVFLLINDTGVISQGIDASVLQGLGIIS